jgi:hypothetical protein
MTFTFDISLFSDFYKDANGFRPRDHRFYAPETTDEQRQEMWDDILLAGDREFKRAEAAEKAAVASFEALVANNIVLGAETREDAIRWIIQGLDVNEWDVGYPGFISWKLDLPSSYDAEFKEVLNVMFPVTEEV